MRSLLPATLGLPLLTLAAPPSPPRITSLVFSGTGCPNSSGSVKIDSSTLSDSANVSFSQLTGDSTDNCGIHIQSSGGSAGWQVALSQITYEGNVVLRGNSQLDTYTQVFWSENAGNTVRTAFLNIIFLHAGFLFLFLSRYQSPYIGLTMFRAFLQAA